MLFVFAVAIAKLMELSNLLTDGKDDGTLSKQEFALGLRTLVLLLSPMAPVAGVCFTVFPE